MHRNYRAERLGVLTIYARLFWEHDFLYLFGKGLKMKESMGWFLDRSYLVEYAVLLAVTITLAMAIGGRASLASDGVAGLQSSLSVLLLPGERGLAGPRQPPHERGSPGGLRQQVY